ncbi:MAG: MFS transporter [Chloroflexi bacterium]|nr:MFS transporter [Chloroflexota bacterium]
MVAPERLAAWVRGQYYGWTLVVVLGITTMVSYGTTYYAFGALLIPITHAFGWSRGDVSGAYSLGLVVAGLAGVPVGAWVDRVGARWPMTLGSLITGISLMGLARIEHAWQLYLLWGFGIGIGAALTFYPVSFTVVANWFNLRRGRALAWLTLIGGGASPIFIPLIGWLLPHIGWRATVVYLGLAQLLVALPLHALFLRGRPEALGLTPDGAAAGVIPKGRPLAPSWTARGVLRHPAFWTLTAAFLLEQVASAVVLVHQIPFLVDKGFGQPLAAAMAGLVGLVSLPGRFVLNVLSDRVSRSGLLAGVLVSQALALVLLILADSEGWLYAYVLLTGLGYGTRSPLRAAIMGDVFGRGAFGAIFAIQGAAVSVLAATGPALAGWAYDRAGAYQVVFSMMAAALLVAAAVISWTPRGPAVPAPEGDAPATPQR